MLTRLADRAARASPTRSPIVSLLPGRGLRRSSCARPGVTVVELDFGSAGGIVVRAAQARQADRRDQARHRAGLDVSRRSRGARRARPVGTAPARRASSGAFAARTWISGATASGCALVVKACAMLSRWPDLITANSAAGLKSHLRPRLSPAPRRGRRQRHRHRPASSPMRPRARRCAASSASPTTRSCSRMSRASTR